MIADHTVRVPTFFCDTANTGAGARGFSELCARPFFTNIKVKHSAPAEPRIE